MKLAPMFSAALRRRWLIQHYAAPAGLALTAVAVGYGLVYLISIGTSR